MFGVRFAIP